MQAKIHIDDHSANFGVQGKDAADCFKTFLGGLAAKLGALNAKRR